MKPTFQSDCGHVTLYCGDGVEIAKTLQGVDCVCIDPPYGIGFASQPTTGGRKRGQSKETWDNNAIPYDQLKAVLSIASIQIVWGGNYYPLPMSRGWICWYKPDAPPSMADFELAWTNQDQNSIHISHSIAATNPERVGHPTQKPVRVMMKSLLETNVGESATVFDAFMGSGTTGIACLRTGRKFIGCEIDPQHYQTAESRIRRELAQLKLNL